MFSKINVTKKNKLAEKLFCIQRAEFTSNDVDVNKTSVSAVPAGESVGNSNWAASGSMLLDHGANRWACCNEEKTDYLKLCYVLHLLRILMELVRKGRGVT